MRVVGIKLFATSIFTLLWLAASPLQASEEASFDVRWIEVHGEFERVTAEQVRTAAAPLARVGFFQLELDAVRERVLALPWVRAAQVRKRWPDRIEITVYEYQPVARWGDDSLVDADGNIFSVPGSEDMRALIQLIGPDDQVKTMLAFSEAVRFQLEQTGMDLAQLILSELGAWKATLRNGMELNLGRDEPLERLDRVVTVFDELLADPARVPKRIDLRYTNGFAVKWQEQPTDVIAAAVGQD